MKYFLALACLFCACVQKTSFHTVYFRLRLPPGQSADSVSIRGGDAPLSWDRDTLLRKLPGDSVYALSITYRSGYRFTEVKFAADGHLELEGKPNRRVYWGARDSITYDAVLGRERLE